MIRVAGTIFAGLLGLAFGSFLNVCLSRWPAGESIVHPRSHCMSCGRKLAWRENVPLVSWLALRGRCRTCSAPISWRYPLVELAVGAGWALIALQSLPRNADSVSADLLWPLAIYCVSQMIFLWLLTALAILDFENLWLPNKITIPGTLAGFGLTFLYTAVNSERVFGFYGALASRGRFLWNFAWHRLTAIVVAAGVILFTRWIYWLLRRREGVGLGDAKLMAMLAAWLGFSGALLSFVIGVLLGAVVALVLLGIPSARQNKKSWMLTKLPLGTFLCVGGVVSCFWGEPMIHAYLRWAGF
ncbi:MAG TPA: prepilin peptidase [Terracidiphilus sp.]|jgi:leader peptidase (prepilin peptidase)/N-methyltransferase